MNCSAALMSMLMQRTLRRSRRPVFQKSDSCESRQPAYLVGHVRLAGVPGIQRTKGKIALAGSHQPAQPGHAGEHLGPVPDGVDRAPIELPLADPELGSHGCYAG